MKRNFVVLAILVLLVSETAMADVALVTVPRRESTQLTIYNSEDITMVREHRMLTVKKGRNRIQFTWANTLIDPTSIDFRILDHLDKVVLLDTTFPSGRNDALQWNIRSEMDGKIPVEIRYFTSGITWQADYAGIANQDETEMDMKGYVRVINRSGETYDNAQVRLVVGNINLVEKIADLARRGAPVSTMRGIRGDGGVVDFKDYDAVEEVMMDPSDFADEGGGGGGGWGIVPGATATKRPVVKKQSLSEYFLFTIAGREDIKAGTPIRLVALDVEEVPLECIYKLTDRSGPQQFTKYYRFTNEKLTEDDGAEKDLPDMENLGLSPIPDGNVRLYFQYPNRDLAYVGGTATKYVPIGDRIEVNVGTEPGITIRRVLKDRKTTGVVARQYRERTSNTYVRYYDLIDYDETLIYEEEIISGKATLSKVEVERRFDANVYLWTPDDKPDDFDGDEPGAYVDMHEIDGRIERVDQNYVKYFVDLEPGNRRIVRYTVTYKRRKVGPRLNVVDRREPISTKEEPEKPVEEIAPGPVDDPFGGSPASAPASDPFGAPAIPADPFALPARP